MKDRMTVRDPWDYKTLADAYREAVKVSDQLAHYIHMLMEGDTHMIEGMFDLLRKHGYADEDGSETNPTWEDE